MTVLVKLANNIGEWPSGKAADSESANQRFESSLPSQANMGTAADEHVGVVEIRAWNGLHPRHLTCGLWKGRVAAPIVRGTVIRVDVQLRWPYCSRQVGAGSKKYR